MNETELHKTITPTNKKRLGRKEKCAERYRRLIQSKRDAELYRLDQRARLVEKEAK